MARHFVAASSQYLDNASTPGVTAPPYTLAAWIKTSADTGVVLDLQTATANPLTGSIFLNLQANSTIAGGSLGSGVVGYLISSQLHPRLLNAWNHIAVTQDANYLTKVYVNGVLSVTGILVISFTAPAAIQVGRVTASGVSSQYFDGDMAHIAVWSSVLTPAQILSLSTDTLPSSIGSPVHYWPLAGTASPEPDLGSSNKSLTVHGATQSSSPTLGSNRVFVRLNSLYASDEDRIDMQSMRIRDVINEQPNTAALVIRGSAPQSNQDIAIWLGNPSNMLFAGTITNVSQGYDSKTSNLLWSVDAIDYAYLLDRRRPVVVAADQSATTFVKSLITTYSSGFTSLNVDGALPNVNIGFDGSKTLSRCLTDVANLIGAKWFVDYNKDIHFFLYFTHSDFGSDLIDDNFTGTNGTNITSHTPNTNVPGNSWVKTGGTPAATLDGSNSVTIASGAGSGQTQVTIDSGVSDAVVGVDWHCNSANPSIGGVIFRYTDSNNYMLFYHQPVLGAVVGLNGIIGGTGVVFATASIPAAATAGSTHHFEVRLNGPVIECWYDRVKYITVSTSSLQSSTKHGFYFNSAYETSSKYSGFQVNNISLHHPDDISSVSLPLNDPPLLSASNGDQIRTRVYGRGHSDIVATNVNASDTIIPLKDTSATFNPLGGKVILDNNQILAYTGTRGGGVGTTVGPGATPSSAPALASAAGSGVDNGTHLYAITFVTAAGETTPGPTSSITLSAVAAPSSAPIAAQSSYSAFGTTAWNAGDTIEYALTYVTAVGETTAGPLSNAVTGAVNPTFGNAQWCIDLTSIPVPSDPAIISKNLYRRQNGVYTGNAGKVHSPMSNNATGFAAEGSIGTGSGPPGANTASGNHVALTGIQIGPAGTTQRKVYRTTAGGAQLKLVTTIADNTTTTYTDSTADASLGANAPSTNTSGLVVAAGQVNAGSTTLPVAGTGAFYSGGGWVNVGSQTIRYTGLTSTDLTGIPSSGNGAIQATVSYSATATEAPSLTGVSGLSAAVVKGTKVSVWSQRDNTSAQAALAAIEGGDGIHEYLFVDDGMGYAALDAACDAQLFLFSNVINSLSYSTLDTKTRSGDTVHVSTGAPLNISGDFVIVSVDIDQIGLPTKAPQYNVKASSVKFTFEDLLRRLLIS